MVNDLANLCDLNDRFKGLVDCPLCNKALRQLRICCLVVIHMSQGVVCQQRARHSKQLWKQNFELKHRKVSGVLGLKQVISVYEHLDNQSDLVIQRKESLVKVHLQNEVLGLGSANNFN